jgi:diguanylate cyclase (GGDEF)-like protein/putative nucleotidyltransferase with HDIG domain
MTIAEGVEHKRNSESMTTDHSTALVLHDDTIRRSRIASNLRPRGLSITNNAGPIWEPGNAPQRPFACAVVQLSRRGDATTDQSLSRLRQQIGGARIIALTPPGDVATARDAFHAGVWDCLEDSVSDDELADRIYEAWKGNSDPQAKSSTDENALSLMTHSAFLDGLTGFRSQCHGKPVSIIMLDIDRFSECNVNYSPAFGDRVLDRVGTILKSVCHSRVLVTRYEGDRFIAAFPNARAPQAIQFTRRCRWALGVLPFEQNNRELDLSFSVGIAESSVGFVETEQQLIERAEAALEEAKQRGSNQTVTWSELLDTDPSLGKTRTTRTTDASRWVDRLRHHLRSTYVESTMALVAAAEAKDPCTQSHSLTVADYAEGFGKRMRLPARMIEALRVAALLHDIGKIGVPDSILTKPGPLSGEEFDVVKKHPETALDILSHVSFLTDVKPMILHHHERFDGTGYPAGLKGDQIPIGARVLCVADAVDTMRSPRSYKKPYTLEKIRNELMTCSGTQFDPVVAQVAIEWLDETPALIPAV